MQIVIDIPEHIYKSRYTLSSHAQGLKDRIIFDAVKNGTVLTECKDTISREDAIKLVECSGYDLQFRSDNADMCDDVRKLPSVTPSSRKGHWIDRSEGGRIKYPWMEAHECDKCGEYGSAAWNFCPNCGADMRGTK